MYNTKAGTIGMVIIKASGSDPDGWKHIDKVEKWRVNSGQFTLVTSHIVHIQVTRRQITVARYCSCSLQPGPGVPIDWTRRCVPVG